MKFIIKIILTFLSYVNLIFSLKFNPTDILYKEDLLLKSHLDSIKDSRQKNILLKKIQKFDNNNVQRKKLSSEEIFFDDYSNQMNEYSVYSKMSQDYENFHYLTYIQIIEKMKKFVQKFPNLINITTSQKLYNLPNPIGDCDGEKCENFIIFLGNKSKFKNDTPQMYISCAVHGDEKVGPTLCIEYVELLLENYEKDKWIKYLLDNRRVIITPMTNAYGYYLGIREEITDKIDFLTNDYKVDPNRDFPMLKRKSECMTTITARTINEIFVNNLIKLSFSIHGGTASLTYAWGTPNHLKEIDDKYKFNKNKLNRNSLNKDEIIEAYYAGYFDEITSDSYDSPDDKGLITISKILSQNSNHNSDFQYKTGTMSSLVYPVRGAFEDWAYSGSWEGKPIITQPCQPNSYNKYDSNKTNYDKFYKDAIKSVSLLLETSDSKSPPEVNLGLRRPECYLNVIRNPFRPDYDTFIEKECLGSTFNGYISKNIRLLLITLDMLQPYVNVIHSLVKPKENNYLISLKWIVGGCNNVDETFVIFDLVDRDDKSFDNFISNMIKLNFKNIKQELLENNNTTINENNNDYRPLTGKIQKGNGIWNLNNLDKNTNFIFEEILRIPKNIIFENKNEKSNKKLKFIILTKVDQDWKSQISPDPKLSPQTHFINERINPNYTAENNGFVINGKNYFYSDVIIKNIE